MYSCGQQYESSLFTLTASESSLHAARPSPPPMYPGLPVLHSPRTLTLLLPNDWQHEKELLSGVSGLYKCG